MCLLPHLVRIPGPRSTAHFTIYTRTFLGPRVKSDILSVFSASPMGNRTASSGVLELVAFHRLKAVRSVHLSAPFASSCCLSHMQTQHSASGAPSASLWSSLIPHIIVFFTGSGCFTLPTVPEWLAHFWEMTVPLLGLLPCTEIQKASTKEDATRCQFPTAGPQPAPLPHLLLYWFW